MKKIFTLLTCALMSIGSAWGADATCTYTQPSTTLDLASGSLSTTLAGISWTPKDVGTLKAGYLLSDDYLELPVLTLACTTSITWGVSENAQSNPDKVDWAASGIFHAYSSFFNDSGKNNVIKSRTTRYVAVKVTSCTAAYVYGENKVSINVYEVGAGDESKKITELTSAGTATTTATEVKSVTGLDPNKTYIVQVAGSTSSNAKAYAMALKRAVKTTTSANAAVSDQSFICHTDNATGISGSGADEVTFSGLGTLTGSNLQSGTVTFTVDGNDYKTMKADKVTYELTSNAGVTIKGVTLYGTSINDNTMTITTGSGATNLANSGETPTQIALTKNGGGNYYFTVSGDTYQALVVLKVTYDKVENVDVTVSAAGYATLYYGKNLTVPTGVTAYKAAISGSNIELTDIGDLIPANTGVILKADAGKYNFITTTADASAVDVSGNILSGTTSATTRAALGGKVFTLGQDNLGVVGLRNYTGTDIRAYCAYSTNDGLSALARAFYPFDEDGDVTGISTIPAPSFQKDDIYYDLNGHRVLYPKKGLYIVNGKKVILK